MDMDTTLINYPLNKDSIEKAIQDISGIKLDNDVDFIYKGIAPIRKNERIQFLHYMN